MRSTEVVETLTYLPHATLDELGEMLEDEAARGGAASLRVVSAIASRAFQELKETPEHQRSGAPIENLERRARNLLADLRKARPSPSKERAKLVAARQRRSPHSSASATRLFRQSRGPGASDLGVLSQQ